MVKCKEYRKGTESLQLDYTKFVRQTVWIKVKLIEFESVFSTKFVKQKGQKEKRQIQKN